MTALPLDERGYPIPFFVAFVGGKPEFRVADAEKRYRCVKQKLCWMCGNPLNHGKHTFVIGPMGALNRTTDEPPCHNGCAEFSVKACPFLSMPKAKRRDAGIPEEARHPAGISIDRNPGVTCLWTCRGYQLFHDGRGGALFKIPNPSCVRWWTEGRKASRGEVLASINSGLSILQEMANQDGPESTALLEKLKADVMKFIPAFTPMTCGDLMPEDRD
jgi:hypothetical protein